MNWQQMKTIEPELVRLEASAHNAGRHQATWTATLMAVHETLSKLVGRGASNERLQSAACYEAARAGLFAAWSRGVKDQPIPPTTPPQHADGVQTTFLDVSEIYQ